MTCFLCADYLSFSGEFRIEPFEAGIHIDFNGNFFVSERLQVSQTVRLQHQTLVVADHSVKRVIHDRITDVGKVDADLMFTSG